MKGFLSLAPPRSPINPTVTSLSPNNLRQMTSQPSFLRLSLAVRKSTVDLPEVSAGICRPRAGWKRAELLIPSSRCRAMRKLGVMQGTFPNGLSVFEWPETVQIPCKEETEETLIKVLESSKIRQHVAAVRAMLQSMGDGEITISAYDTAWVALVEDIHGRGGPQFPTSLKWIIENQLIDGSWGDLRIFSAHDRIINTLACVIAMKSWNICPERCEKGMSFLRENMGKLEDENEEHMPIGFEIAFPSLIEIARTLGLEVPLDSPVLDDIYAKRNLKLARIPKEVMHKVPTTLLHSLEGMPGLDWERLLNLQSSDGSFLFSPSSTAFALMQTRNNKCLEYLQKAVERFNGGVPNVYPVDLFEHLWAVDRLERLGVSRFFGTEIEECLDYVYRHWNEDGICWARNSEVHDIDDTSMGFRILRLHGYDISSEAFRHFKNGSEFFCFAGQSNPAVTGIYNLNRASQVMFPGDKILEDARSFSYKFLREKQAAGQLLDKWIITKDLPGEVGYTLEFPWYASLPRVETRFYLEQYGGEDDTWIGKTLYRMPYVNNDTYLDLAKLDFNNCQAVHQLEWLEIQKWYRECNLGKLGLSKGTVLGAYFMAAASIFEREKATERLAWARTAVLMEAFSSYLANEVNGAEMRKKDFLQEFNNKRSSSKRTGKGLIAALLGTLLHLSWETLVVHGRDVRYHLRRAWATWLEQAHQDEEEGAELLARTINLCAGRSVSEELLSHPAYSRLAGLTNRLCHKLGRVRKTTAQRKDREDTSTWTSAGAYPVESEMQEILECVLQSSDGLDREIKQTFLSIARSNYYHAYCSHADFDFHTTKVLFERVE